MVQVQGAWTPEALETFRAQLARQGCTPSANPFDTVLARARQHFNRAATHVFLCMGRPCRQRQKFDASAPVATLRAWQRCEMFAQLMRAADWHAVLEFAGRAASAGTLLIHPGEAQAFRFDPVHDPDTGALERPESLHFLLGHFQGHGTFADGSEGFYKEALGSWEVNGRFLGLRMGVTYPLADGHKDTHTALAMLGVNPDTGALDARVYTDGGAVHDYHLEAERDSVSFRDRPQAHHPVQAIRARKVLSWAAYA
ncbi:hypothetical protein NKDENANG_01941 [Candidatus Entotheonellaceae bacterium PAL068K]